MANTNPNNSANETVAPNTLTRQQLYERIRQTSKDEYILSEMIRLGYWQEDADKPSISAQLIQEESQLQQRLTELLEKKRLIDDPERALKVLHKERKKKALERRELTKQLHNEKRYERAQAWYQTNQTDIPYLGDGTAISLLAPSHEASDSKSDVSENNESKDKLTKTQAYPYPPSANPERLSNQGLLDYASVDELANAMGISINELRFLSFHRKTAKVTHYQQFLIAKKTGGTRRISAPMPRLKHAQYWVLTNILEKLALHDSAHGFITQRSIVTNAQPHVGKSVVINMDLKDFFPTISYRRIKGLFHRIGYSEKIATILALLCSEPDRDEVILDGESYFTANGERHLPQGAPTSPAISNLICRKLDRRIQGACESLNFSYTRYADDLTFSFNGSNSDAKTAPVTQLLWRVKKIIADEGFVVHPDKTRIMRAGSRQEVTGVVVNNKLSVNRASLKRFRALLYQIEHTGLQGKSWGNATGDNPTELWRVITGYANYVAMVNPDKGKPFQQKINALKQQHSHKDTHGKQARLNKKHLKASASKGKLPSEDWWQAQTPPPPLKEKTASEIQAEKNAFIEAEKQRNAPQHNSDDSDEYNDSYSNSRTSVNYSQQTVAPTSGFSAYSIRERQIRNETETRDNHVQQNNQSSNQDKSDSKPESGNDFLIKVIVFLVVLIAFLLLKMF